MKNNNPSATPDKARNLLIYIALCIISAWCAWPLLWMALATAQRSPTYPNTLASSSPSIIGQGEAPVSGNWIENIKHNYQAAFSAIPFWRCMATSLFLALLAVAGTVLFCPLAAWGFARLHWPGRTFCFGLLLATILFPAQSVIVPQFLLFSSTGWFNTLLPLWLPYFFASSAGILLCWHSVRQMPPGIEDAAKMEGCRFPHFYWHILLPHLKPKVATAALLTFLAVWGDFLGALIYLKDPMLHPLALGIYNMSANGSGMGMMMAASLLLALPAWAVFFLVDRYLFRTTNSLFSIP